MTWESGERLGDSAGLHHKNCFPILFQLGQWSPEMLANKWFLGQKGVFKIFHTRPFPPRVSVHMNILKVLGSTAVKKSALLCSYFNTDQYTTLIDTIWRIFPWLLFYNWVTRIARNKEPALGC